MKKMIVLVAIVMLFAVSAMAETVQNPGWATPSTPVNEFLNEYGQHRHEIGLTSKYKAPIGFGVDLTLYEMDVAGLGLGFGVDTEYDVNNGVFGTMAKVRVNTTDLINTLIGK